MKEIVIVSVGVGVLHAWVIPVICVHFLGEFAELMQPDVQLKEPPYLLPMPKPQPSTASRHGWCHIQLQQTTQSWNLLVWKVPLALTSLFLFAEESSALFQNPFPFSAVPSSQHLSSSSSSSSWSSDWLSKTRFLYVTSTWPFGSYRQSLDHSKRQIQK